MTAPKSLQDELGHRFPGTWDGQPDRASRAEQPVDMLGQLEHPAGVCADALVDAVTVQQPVVEDRDPRRLWRQILSIDVDETARLPAMLPRGRFDRTHLDIHEHTFLEGRSAGRLIGRKTTAIDNTSVLHAVELGKS